MICVAATASPCLFTPRGQPELPSRTCNTRMAMLPLHRSLRHVLHFPGSSHTGFSHSRTPSVPCLGRPMLTGCTQRIPTHCSPFSSGPSPLTSGPQVASPAPSALCYFYSLNHRCNSATASTISCELRDAKDGAHLRRPTQCLQIRTSEWCDGRRSLTVLLSISEIPEELS